jgi:hypothetical protein
MSKDRKPLAFTKHADDATAERELMGEWIERAVYAPQWEVADPVQPDAVRRFRAIPEYGDRILRVVCLETDAEIRILTAFFDRGARKPK